MELNEVEYKLQHLHAKLAGRENISSTLAGVGLELDISFTQTVAMALLSMGGAHAPIVHTHSLFRKSNILFKDEVDRLLSINSKIPGFGSSIVKGKYDPILTEFGRDVFGHMPMWLDSLEEATEFVQERTEIKLFPNAAAYTALTAIAYGKDAAWAERNVIAGRLPFWAYLYRNKGGKPR